VPPAIRTEAISKSFGKTLALDALSLEVGEGEVIGYLGPNGAGKTTTIRLLLGLIRATSAGQRSSASTARQDRWRPTAGSPTCPARPTCGRR